MSASRGNPSHAVTDQDKLWAGEFGDAYIDRNVGDPFLSSSVALWACVLRSAPGISSAVELGCNVGLNLQAIHNLNAKVELAGYEINTKAVEIADKRGIATVVHGSALDPLPATAQYDLAFTKGLLIHIHPDNLAKVYENLYNLSRQYILICEYFNPAPVTIDYRGRANQLFKRDFAGDLIDKYKLTLVDYQFHYSRDPYFPQDNLTWFLLRK
jgi:pseudaminic acid biosynthesis-associated methylase